MPMCIEAKTSQRDNAAFRNRIGEPPLTESHLGDEGKSALRTESILLVEPDADVRAILSRCLEKRGFKVLSAPDALAALTLIKTLSTKPDLLLTAVELSDMTVQAFTSSIRLTNQDIPILFAGIEAYHHGDRLGMGPRERFLQKPLKPSTLHAIACELLDQTN